MPDRLVIGLVGHSGAGKTTASRYAYEHYDIRHYSPQERINTEAKRINLVISTRAASIALLHIMDEKHGRDVLVDPVLKTAHSTMVIDGLSRMYDLNALRAASNIAFSLVAIDTPLAQRIAQSEQLRKERGLSTDPAVFVADEALEAWNPYAPLTPSIDEVTDNADRTIYNTYGSKEEFLEAFDATLQTIMTQYS